MPVTTATQTANDQPTESIEQLSDDAQTIQYIGIEFEYPVAENPERAPASPVTTSGGLRSKWYRENNNDRHWEPGGSMGSDHTGAEIRSRPMSLHSTEPEIWYARSIELATELGYPFGATGCHASTNFGLHLNLSPVPQEAADAIYNIMDEDWSDIFFCASVNNFGADPYRHGGGHSCRSKNDSQIAYDESAGSYREWRLIEPGLPNHVSAIFHYLRLLDTEGPEAAYEYAHDMVWERSEILTPVQQYQILSQDEEWFESAFDGNRRNDPESAEVMAEVMGDA